MKPLSAHTKQALAGIKNYLAGDQPSDGEPGVSSTYTTYTFASLGFWLQVSIRGQFSAGKHVEVSDTDGSIVWVGNTPQVGQSAEISLNLETGSFSALWPGAPSPVDEHPPNFSVTGTVDCIESYPQETGSSLGAFLFLIPQSDQGDGPYILMTINNNVPAD